MEYCLIAIVAEGIVIFLTLNFEHRILRGVERGNINVVITYVELKLSTDLLFLFQME